ncbi:Alcohol dehydrogenase cytochrome c subunit precursor [Serratia odorifera]|jgi:alcohol dehydrogenase (quinone), cytochrome c subunit|uniref:Cytochrome C n=3 Tax=Serratia odorifera TaxID=618 RepID=D4DXT1_SEROD|nr:cytochrome C [Serratia odorifera DSM 4582]PNK91943.1 alcohol dehydrogenase [Serratia odorifera]RII73218.1 cytochrome c [Serratia odorifera]VDZ53851.1 Alcohol dehydrogenase cytochrome c subunit precursor [Serratia odorifera]
MRRSRLKKALLMLLLIGVVAALAIAWFVTRTPASPFDEATAISTPTAELIQRGEYVARLSDCVACHSTPDSKPFAGGLEMATPMGAIFATNITPDKQTGIGSYRLADFDRALRQGVAADGHRLYPAMPYPSYAKLSDEDVQALYAFFLHGVSPVSEQNRPSEIPWPLNMRWPLALWNALFTESEPYQAKNLTNTGEEEALWNRGAYIVQGAGHCGSCHTPRSVAMNEKALTERSPLYLSGALLDGWYAPSLRGDHNTGLGRWSEEEIVQLLKTGRNKHAVVFGSMTEAFNNSTQFMTDYDLKAVAHYLKSLPGDAERDGEPWQYDASAHNRLSPAQRLKVPGAQTFAAKCSACHGQDGRGQGQWIPPLAGSASSLAKENASSINITLNGSMRIVANGVPDAYRMPPFRNQLSDREIAEVLSFVRTSWGNHGGAVQEAEVKQLRERTDPASSNVIILQMR